MSTEVLEPHAAPVTAEHDFSESAAAFDLAMGNEPETKPDAAKPDATEKAETKSETKPDAKPAESEFPAEMMTGEKAVVKVETSPEDDVLKAEPPANLSKKGAADWVKLRDVAAKNAAAAEAARKELEVARKPVAAAPDEATVAELKAAREQLAQAEQELGRASVERSAPFRKLVADEGANITLAKSYLEGTEIDPSIIDRAASLSGANRLKALRESGMDAETISTVAPYLAALDGINRQKTEALANHKETAAQWEAQEAARAEQQKARERAEDERVYKAVGLEVAAKFEPFQKVDGHERWNAQVDTLTAEAKEFFSGNMPVEKLAEIAYYGVGARVIHSMFHATRAQLKSALEENAKLKAAQPGGGEEVRKTTAEEEAKLDPFERAAKEFDRQMGR